MVSLGSGQTARKCAKHFFRGTDGDNIVTIYLYNLLCIGRDIIDYNFILNLLNASFFIMKINLNVKLGFISHFNVFNRSSVIHSTSRNFVQWDQPHDSC